MRQPRFPRAHRGGALAIAVFMTLFPVPSMAAALPGAGTLVVVVNGVQPGRGGDLIAHLFDDAGAWLKADRARARKGVPVAGETARLEFEGLPKGTYAVQVLHDQNRNGVLDRRSGPIPLPTEGTGTSNNQRRMGPPLYEAARVTLEGDTLTVEIVLRYY
jgi:uncharacterized protein (DUF2141 family)